MAQKEEIALLHTHGQEAWHDEAYIVGNRAGLEALLEALQQALRSPSGSAGVDLFVSDGEGYRCLISLNDDPWRSESWIKAAVPYTAPYARENRDDAIWPWSRHAGNDHGK